METEERNAEVKASSLRLGPKGLGDPDDLSLRRVELQVKIPEKMREKARVYKCPEEVKAFNQCGLQYGLKSFYKCREENNVLKECLLKWLSDENFKKECIKEYLEERSMYRRTGIPVKQYRRKPEVQNQETL